MRATPIQNTTYVGVSICVNGCSVKWKLKGSLESQLCWMVFCWGKHVKECFPEVDTGERLGQTHKCFTEADTGERMFC